MKHWRSFFKLSFVIFLLLFSNCCQRPWQQPIMPVVLLINHYPLWQDDRGFFKRVNPYGFLLGIPYHPNINPNKLRAELEEILGRKDFLFFLDQEGGAVNRLRMYNEDFATPSAKQYGDIARDDFKYAVSKIYNDGKITGKELKKFSFDVALAPVAEVIDSDNVFGRKRYYSTDPKTTKVLADTFAKGLASEAITPCYKHFPGFPTEKDPHYHHQKVDASIDEILSKVYPAFKQANKYGCLLTGHALFTAIDKENISTYSPAFYKFVRKSLNYKGIIITDGLNMRAANDPQLKTVGERMNKALAAGADVVMPFFPIHESTRVMEEQIRQIDPQYIKRFQQRARLIKRKK